VIEVDEVQDRDVKIIDVDGLLNGFSTALRPITSVAPWTMPVGEYD